MFEAIGKASVLTFILSGVAVGFAAYRTKHADARAAVATVLAAAAFVSAVTATSGFPSLPPAIAVDWAPWLVVLAAVFGVAILRLEPWWAPAYAALTLSLATSWLILDRLDPDLSFLEWKRTRRFAWVALFALAFIPDAVERRRRQPLPRGPVIVALFFAAPTIGWSSSAHLASVAALLFGAVGGTWAGLAVALRERPRERLAFVPATGLGALLVGAWAFADLALPHALLLAASALCTIIDDPRRRWVAYAGLALSAALGGAAAVQARAAAATAWPSMFGA